MRRIAYLISAYKDAPHLARLMDALDDGAADFYVHVDANADIAPFRRAAGERAVFVGRHAVGWGGWSQVAYQRELLEAAVGSGRDYLRAVCLSGQDYPLWGNARIRQFFEDNPEAELIGGMDLAACTDRKLREKVTLRHPFRDLRCKNRWWKGKMAAGGRLLYSTCTLLEEENGGVVRAFLKDGGFTVRQERTLWPDTDGMDGFYLCLMERSQ